MDNCQYCGRLYDPEYKEGTVHHFEVCVSESMLLVNQFRELIKKKSFTEVRCNACIQHIPRDSFVEHIFEFHDKALHLFRRLNDRQESTIVNSPDETIVNCRLCDEKYPAGNETHHNESRHTDGIFLVKQLANKLNSTPPITFTCPTCGDEYSGENRGHKVKCRGEQTISDMESLSTLSSFSEDEDSKENDSCMAECKRAKRDMENLTTTCSFCGIEYLEENGINHLAECKGEDLVLVQQLSDRLKYAANCELKFSLSDRCEVCHMKFPINNLVGHLSEYHPSCFDLVMKIMNVVERDPDMYCKKCGICGYENTEVGLKDHFKEFHPGTLIMARQVSKEMGLNFEEDTDGTSSDVSSLMNKSIVDEASYSEVIRGMDTNLPSLVIDGCVNMKPNMHKEKVDIFYNTINKRQILPKNKATGVIKYKNNKWTISNFAKKFPKKKKLQPLRKKYCSPFVKSERLSLHSYKECKTKGILVLQKDYSDTMTSTECKEVISKETVDNSDLKDNPTCIVDPPEMSMDANSVNKIHEPKENDKFADKEDTLIFQTLQEVPLISQEDITKGNVDEQGEEYDIIQSMIDYASDVIAASQEYMIELKEPSNADHMVDIHKECENNSNKSSIIDANSLETIVWKEKPTPIINKLTTVKPKEPCSVPFKTATLAGVADLGKLPKQFEKVENFEMVNLLDDMSVETQEIKYELQYHQDQLTNFVINRKEISPYLKAKLVSAHQHTTNPALCKRFLNELLGIRNSKLRDAVRILLRNFINATKKQSSSTEVKSAIYLF